MFENWFTPGKGRKRMKEEVDALNQLIFPYGPEHKERIEALLHEIDGKKLNKTSIMISFIEGKQRHLGGESLLSVYRTVGKSPAGFRDTQIRQIVALIVLDAGSGGLENLPEFPQVEEYARTLTIE